MTFSPLYAATEEANQFTIAGDTVNYSNSSDTVVVDQSESIRGQHTLLHSGSDVYAGTEFDSIGWDNIANGNRGEDTLRGGLSSRDFLRGGKDDDLIDGMFEGDDLLCGDFGDDIVLGALQGHNILRGGKGDDLLQGGFKRDLLIGDPGKDTLWGNGGSDLFLLRTDSLEDGLSNLTPNAAEADRIMDFTAEDRLVITGVQSPDDVKLLFSGNDLLVSVETAQGAMFAGVIDNPGFMPNAEQIVIGDTANSILGIGEQAYLQNSNILHEITV